MEVNKNFKKHTKIHIKDFSEKNKEGKIIIKGYASTWNTDLVGDDMIKGCFEDSIKKNNQKWFVLFNHNPDNIIGINTKAIETDEGLYIESEIFENEKTKTILNVVKASIYHNHPIGLSIGGKIVDMDLKKESMGFKINKFHIKEHSITPIPCNEQSRIEEVKEVTKSLYIRDKKNNFEKELIDRIDMLNTETILREIDNT